MRTPSHPRWRAGKTPAQQGLWPAGELVKVIINNLTQRHTHVHTDGLLLLNAKKSSHEHHTASLENRRPKTQGHARPIDHWLSTWDCCPLAPRQADWGEGTGRRSPAPQADSRWGWALPLAPHSSLYPIRQGLSGVTQFTGQLPTHPGSADEDTEWGPGPLGQ